MWEAFREVKFHSYDSQSRMAYVEIGHGNQTLVFLHGMSSNQKAWAKNISILQSNFKCISLDLPGYGFSDVFPEKYDIPKVAKLIIDFINTKRLESVTLVGHSMGGQLSLEIVRQEPQLISRLILIAPAGLEVFLPKEIDLIQQYYTLHNVHKP